MRKRSVAKNIINATLRLGKLIFQFARIERAATHENGVRHETDTHNTVSLALHTNNRITPI